MSKRPNISEQVTITLYEKGFTGNIEGPILTLDQLINDVKDALRFQDKEIGEDLFVQFSVVNGSATLGFLPRGATYVLGIVTNPRQTITPGNVPMSMIDLTIAKNAFEVPLIPTASAFSVANLEAYCVRVADSNNFQHRVIIIAQSSGFGKSRYLEEVAQNRWAIYINFTKSEKSFPRPSATASIFLNVLNTKTASMDQIALDIQRTIARLLMFCSEHEHCATPAEWYDVQKNGPITLPEFPGDEKAVAYIIENFCDLHEQKYLIIVADEAGDLLCDNTTLGVKLYRLFRRAFTFNINPHLTRLVGLFASTNARIQNLAPSEHRDPSVRIRNTGTYLTLPISAVSGVDLFFKQKQTELQTQATLLSIQSIEMKCSFGRPLWGARLAACPQDYEERTKRFEIEEFAKTKLTVGVQDFDERGAFALIAMTTHISFVPTSELAEALVKEYMAVLYHVSSDRELLYTSYASECVLSKVAKVTLQTDPEVRRNAVKQLLHNYSKGFINLGDSGEFLARLCLVLTPSSTWKALGFLELDDLVDKGTVIEDGAKILNFNHWYQAAEPVSKDLLFAAFLRQAAIVPEKNNQKAYDMVIPYYVSSSQGVKTRVTPDNMCAIFLQIKNRDYPVNARKVLAWMNEIVAPLSLHESYTWLIQPAFLKSEMDIDFPPFCNVWSFEDLINQSTGSDCLDFFNALLNRRESWLLDLIKEQRLKSDASWKDFSKVHERFFQNTSRFGSFQKRNK